MTGRCPWLTDNVPTGLAVESLRVGVNGICSLRDPFELTDAVVRDRCKGRASKSRNSRFGGRWALARRMASASIDR